MKVYYRNKPIGTLESLIISNIFDAATYPYPEIEHFITSIKKTKIIIVDVDLKFILKLFGNKLSEFKFKIKGKYFSGNPCEWIGGTNRLTIILEDKIKFGGK